MTEDGCGVQELFVEREMWGSVLLVPPLLLLLNTNQSLSSSLAVGQGGGEGGDCVCASVCACVRMQHVCGTN